jgi:hypothetical protein
MNPDRIVAKAEAWKRRAHRLSLNLRLKSIAEANGFLREHSLVLWNAKAELPNLLDAIIGRVANGHERVYGKPAENCYLWRQQIMKNQEFLECHFFSKLATVVHQDLWPYITVFARHNRKLAEEESRSREAKRILSFLNREGPTRSDVLRKELRLTTPEQGRLFHRAKKDLQNHLVIVGKADEGPRIRAHAEVLDFWENCIPKQIKTKADQMDQAGACLKLLSATLQSCVLSKEKKIPTWFNWTDSGIKESLEKLIQRKDFVRVLHRKECYIVPRKIL